jgi:outer membrane receptor protein involved in Fe transport
VDNEWYLSQSHRLDFGSWISAVETEYVATLGDTINLFSRKNSSMQASFYLQDKWKLSDAVQFTLGLRMTHYDKTDQFYLEPRASITYAMGNYVKLKGAWGQYNQYMHRITNENVLEGSRDFWLIADQDFEPGYAEHFIAGMSYEDKNYLFDVEAYYKDLDNLIEYTRRFRQRADYGELFFFGSGISKGVEFLAQKKRGIFSGWVSYTLGKIEHTFPNLNNADPFAALHDRRHEVKTVGTYSLGKWSFSATWVFASGQPYTSPEAQYYLDMLDGESQSYIHVGEKNANRLPDYHRLDVSATRHIFPLDNWDKRRKDSWSIDLGVSVFNLYNHNNVWYRRYDLEVTPIVITDVKMLGITPTVFLKVKF